MKRYYWSGLALVLLLQPLSPLTHLALSEEVTALPFAPGWDANSETFFHIPQVFEGPPSKEKRHSSGDLHMEQAVPGSRVPDSGTGQERADLLRATDADTRLQAILDAWPVGVSVVTPTPALSAVVSEELSDEEWYFEQGMLQEAQRQQILQLQEAGLAPPSAPVPAAPAMDPKQFARDIARIIRQSGGHAGAGLQR